jgi:hypothetical protein
MQETPRSFRISRRRLAQSVAGGALTIPFLTPGSFALAQESGLTTLRVANEAEPAALDPWMRGYAQTLVTRQI